MKQSGPVDVSVNTASAVVSVKTLFEATKMIRNGALAGQFIQSTFKATNTRFNAVMATGGFGGANITHMYDWGMIGAPTGRLWEAFLMGQGKNTVVTFTYLPSRRKVPLPEILQEAEEEGEFRFRRHVFKMKAMAFESGLPFEIKRKQSDWLVWANRVAGWDSKKKNGKDGLGGTRYSVDKRGIAFSQGVSSIGKGFGGGKYQGNFNSTFLAWWTTGPGIGVSANEIARRLESSSKVRMERAAAQTRRLSNARQTMSDSQSTAKARQMAAAVIKQIEGDLK